MNMNQAPNKKKTYKQEIKALLITKIKKVWCYIILVSLVFTLICFGLLYLNIFKHQIIFIITYSMLSFFIFSVLHYFMIPTLRQKKLITNWLMADKVFISIAFILIFGSLSLCHYVYHYPLSIYYYGLISLSLLLSYSLVSFYLFLNTRMNYRNRYYFSMYDNLATKLEHQEKTNTFDANLQQGLIQTQSQYDIKHQRVVASFPIDIA